ncbi:response regulator transcription factor [Haloactinomyces albus]|uniref:Two-component system nitrate/nitrite response regulator NarL n=1 Tax=Haloactinomyces albus TaxID=1352928 RepID=A0AAE3Z8A3_9ACTN|nr:response regulator transcription factor [Haloactinomyces albus]MDR7300168.1 two-component system nitrate/nitrite response regulator NarL [Haloactinomyces albus]
MTAPPFHEDKPMDPGHSCPVDMVRLLMVDDHRMLTEALTNRLSATPDLWVVGQSTTHDPDLTETVARLRPDVIVIDVEPAGTATRELLERLTAAWSSANIVVLTAGNHGERVVDAARAGAAAWVPKERGAEELTGILRGVCSGHSWFPPEVLGTVLRELREDVRRARDRSGPLDVLSNRERDVLLGMTEGKRGDQIAAELLISAQTVRTHTRSILTKLRVHSRLEAVSVARAAGLRAAEHTSGIVPVQRTPRR